MSEPGATAGRWMRVEVWVQYDDLGDADNFYDAIEDAAHGHEPKGYDCFVSAQINAEPHWLVDEDDGDS
jgi:hypothetical protein